MRKEIIGNATLYLGDCLDVLPLLPKIDAVITDPPYGVGIPYGDAYSDARDTYWPWFKPRLAALREHCPLVVFTHRVTALKELTDWDWCGVWNKPGAFGARVGNSCVLPHWEPILMYGIHASGTKTEYAADVFTFNPEPAKANIKGIGREKWQKAQLVSHPCPKPSVLYDQLVRAFGQNAEVIMDPFMGSGTTAISCMHLQKSFVGIEIEEKYFDLACERIENANRQASMFNGGCEGLTLAYKFNERMMNKDHQDDLLRRLHDTVDR